MQTLSNLTQNIGDDLKGSIPTASQQAIPGTSSLSTGQASSYSSMPFSGQQGFGAQQGFSNLGGQQFQEKAPALGPNTGGFQQGQQYSNIPFQQQGLQGQQLPMQQSNLGAQQFGNVPLQQQGFQGQQLPQQGIQGQQQFSNIPLQQGLQGQQIPQQSLLGSQQYGSALPQQQGFQQGLQGQQFSPLQQQASPIQGFQQGLSSQFQQQGLQGQQGFQQGLQQQERVGMLQHEQIMSPQVQIAPVVLERREAAPVIQERIRREEVEEITPVIHREREKTEIHKVTQPVHTSTVLGVMTESVTLPAKYSEMRTPSMVAPATILPRREELAAQKMRIEKAPVVIETERRKVIEEITPVVYKETIEPHLTRLTLPIYEKIVEGDVYINETRPAQIIAPSTVATNTMQSSMIQNVPMQYAVYGTTPVWSRNLEVADTYVKEGVPLTSGNTGLFGRRAV